MPDIDALDDAVAKIEAEEKAKKAGKMIESVRIWAMRDTDPNRAFFTDLALRLDPKPLTAGNPTMSTEGKHVFFNPEYTLTLSMDETHGVAIGHEPAHCWLKHFSRTQPWMDKETANIAGDLEINGLILEAGFKLPANVVVPGRKQMTESVAYIIKHYDVDIRTFPVGLSFEQYYALLTAKGGRKGGGGGDPDGGYPGDCGGVIPAPDQATAAALEAEWTGAVAAAAQNAERLAAKRGHLSGALKRLIDGILKPAVSGYEILRDYLMRAARDEQTWSRPNRRHLASGLYLPSRTGTVMGDIVVAVDTSGSMTDEQERRCAGLLQEVLELYPAKLTIIYCDAAVHRVTEWNPGDGPLVFDEFPGGGGTDHKPIWREIEERGLEPAVILACTDMATDFGDDPGLPVIWLATEKNDTEPPFGRKITIAE